MVLNNEDKTLIKNLYLFKNYSSRKLIKEFFKGLKTENFELFLDESA